MKNKILLITLLALVMTGCKSTKAIRCSKEVELDDYKYTYIVQGDVKDNKISNISVSVYNKDAKEMGKEFTDMYINFKTIYGDSIEIKDNNIGFVIKETKFLPNNNKSVDVSIKEFKENVKDLDSKMVCKNIK